MLDKKLVRLVNEKSFTSKKNVKVVLTQIQNAYAEKFCEGDLKKAIKELSK